MTDQTVPEVCGNCGARRVGNAEWCARCLQRFEPIEVRVATGPVLHSTVYSRVQKSPLTFGLLGRILITLPFSIVIALLVLDMSKPNGMINLLFLIPVLGIGGFALRDVWQKTPKHAPQVASILGEPEDPDKPKPILPPDLYVNDE